ncbi:hypothetical protein PFICI_06998 [Pestalotiopsis fici W106-1]|uniref:SET domain-containing protein n=1 Tax=Pestalotiopsis fici (strain W106-1 / CGMCC3.15140) TaxID=1229662 RepID=W3X9Z5_PESFW|nr:uncharacterized protein PFICI_06998 [Pestalotiopsis fici W106-1]ETS81996.1 hypothetical protein PFICI_06998 [Pestalotiopsis fici W106-1]
MNRSGRTLQEPIDLTGFTSDESDAVASSRILPKPPNQSVRALQPGSYTRGIINPPILGRNLLFPGPSEHAQMLRHAGTEPSSTPRENPRDHMPSMTSTARTNNKSAPRFSQEGMSSFQIPVHSSQKRVTHQTPRRLEWTVPQIEEALRGLSNDIGIQSARRTNRLLLTSWREATPQNVYTPTKNWFSDMQPIPVEAGKDTLKLKAKQIGPGRTGKQEKREHYQVTGIKTNKEAVPKYDFHYVEISKNILSPNTMLGFVPHLRDLADHEESKYRLWLKELESMDKISGFQTSSRQDKVRKTFQKERATTLLLHLETWLRKLSIDGCTKAALIQHMASQTNAVTPQQKSSILHSYGDGSDSHLSKAVSLFTEAFDKVFNDQNAWEEGAVSLRDVLLLDSSVDSVVDSKKNLKDTPSQVRHIEEGTSVESLLETHALLGCVVCCSYSCEHGEYGLDNERQRFSVEAAGLTSLIRKKATAGGATQGLPQTPCSEDCYLNKRPDIQTNGWSGKETALLRTAIALLCDTSMPAQCLTATFINRPCWDVNRQMEMLNLHMPKPLPKSPRRPKPVAWYDRHKKVLIGDWQEQTMTHEHQMKEHFDPCNHEGPCTRENCGCARNNLMCDRFCHCTAETCAIKFTGCACHSFGQSCLPRQKGEKGEKPCICVQLNRECDPNLCNSCGATERADPRNAKNDWLYTHGCQNCALQRGKFKSLLPGKSTIEGCGYGLFTAEDIRQDDFVIEYVGELISQDEGVRREARRGDIFDEQQQSSYLFTLLEQEGTWVDAAIYGNLSRYINHQDDGNIMPQILYVGGEYRIKFTAQRDIKTGEELFFNYGKEFPNLTKQLLDSQKANNEAHEQDLRGGIEERIDEPREARRQKRGRRPKKSFAVLDSDMMDEVDHDGEDEADHEGDDGAERAGEEMQTPRRGSGPRSRRRVAASPPAVDVETPSRTRRLFSRAQILRSSDNAPTTNQFFQPMENDEQTETTSPGQTSQPGPKKRGRPKRLPQDGAAATNKRGKSGSNKVTRSRVDKSFDDESDTSSTDLISRSRVRKRPARYND